MSEITTSPYLTVAEAAAVLEITESGVYKLIKREKLPALRLSERGTRITRWALESYRRSLNGEGPDTTLPEEALDLAQLRDKFEGEAGMSPAEWIDAWKREEIEDSADNANRLVQALALRDADGQAPRVIVHQEWAVAALTRSTRR